MGSKLIIITGITMAGKSSTAKALVERLQTEGVAIELLKETTTRPKRKSDYSNPEYHFVTDEEYNRKEFLVSTEFKVANGEIWRYGIELPENINTGVIVTSMYSIDSLLENACLPEDLELIIFYLNISKEGILSRDKGDRLYQRGDDVLARIDRDIYNYNKLFEKHKQKEIIYKIGCDTLNLESVVEMIYILLGF